MEIQLMQKNSGKNMIMTQNEHIQAFSEHLLRDKEFTDIQIEGLREMSITFKDNSLGDFLQSYEQWEKHMDKQQSVIGRKMASVVNVIEIQNTINELIATGQ